MHMSWNIQFVSMIIFKNILYKLKANSFLYSPLLISNTLNDVMGKSSVSETPFHAWVTRGNQILPSHWIVVHHRWRSEVTRGNHYCVRWPVVITTLWRWLEVITTLQGWPEVIITLWGWPEVITTVWGWPEVVTTVWGVTRGNHYFVRGTIGNPHFVRVTRGNHFFYESDQR